MPRLHLTAAATASAAAAVLHPAPGPPTRAPPAYEGAGRDTYGKCVRILVE